MAWKHSDMMDINPWDIFAFVNLQTKEKVVGRVITNSDTTLSVVVMDDNGAILDIVKLPEWAFYRTQDHLIKAMYEEIGALPGGDYKNKVWNVKNGKYKPEQYSSMFERLSKIALETPKSIILKYVPDLQLDESMLEQFKF